MIDRGSLWGVMMRLRRLRSFISRCGRVDEERRGVGGVRSEI
jgi:hypothetical protein